MNGVESTDPVIVVDVLLSTLFVALHASNCLLKEMLGAHMREEHDGNMEALCGVRIQILVNDQIEAQAQAQAMAAGGVPPVARH